MSSEKKSFWDYMIEGIKNFGNTSAYTERPSGYTSEGWLPNDNGNIIYNPTQGTEALRLINGTNAALGLTMYGLPAAYAFPAARTLVESIAGVEAVNGIANQIYNLFVPESNQGYMADAFNWLGGNNIKTPWLRETAREGFNLINPSYWIGSPMLSKAYSIAESAVDKGIGNFRADLLSLLSPHYEFKYNPNTKKFHLRVKTESPISTETPDLRNVEKVINTDPLGQKLGLEIVPINGEANGIYLNSQTRYPFITPENENLLLNAGFRPTNEPGLFLNPNNNGLISLNSDGSFILTPENRLGAGARISAELASEVLNALTNIPIEEIVYRANNGQSIIPQQFLSNDEVTRLYESLRDNGYFDPVLDGEINISLDLNGLLIQGLPNENIRVNPENIDSFILEITNRTYPLPRRTIENPFDEELRNALESRGYEYVPESGTYFAREPQIGIFIDENGNLMMNSPEEGIIPIDRETFTRPSDIDPFDLEELPPPPPEYNNIANATSNISDSPIDTRLIDNLWNSEEFRNVLEHAGYRYNPENNTYRYFDGDWDIGTTVFRDPENGNIMLKDDWTPNESEPFNYTHYLKQWRKFNRPLPEGLTPELVNNMLPDFNRDNNGDWVGRNGVRVSHNGNNFIIDVNGAHNVPISASELQSFVSNFIRGNLLLEGNYSGLNDLTLRGQLPINGNHLGTNLGGNFYITDTPTSIEIRPSSRATNSFSIPTENATRQLIYDQIQNFLTNPPFGLNRQQLEFVNRIFPINNNGDYYRNFGDRETHNTGLQIYDAFNEFYIPRSPGISERSGDLSELTEDMLIPKLILPNRYLFRTSSPSFTKENADFNWADYLGLDSRFNELIKSGLIRSRDTATGEHLIKLFGNLSGSNTPKYHLSQGNANFSIEPVRPRYTTNMPFLDIPNEIYGIHLNMTPGTGGALDKKDLLFVGRTLANLAKNAKGSELFSTGGINPTLSRLVSDLSVATNLNNKLKLDVLMTAINDPNYFFDPSFNSGSYSPFSSEQIYNLGNGRYSNIISEPALNSFISSFNNYGGDLESPVKALYNLNPVIDPTTGQIISYPRSIDFSIDDVNLYLNYLKNTYPEYYNRLKLINPSLLHVSFPVATILKKGGQLKLIPKAKSGIHIKKENKGKFTEYCGGKVTDECIQRAKHSSNPKLRKRATFAANARKWSHKKS